MSEATPLVSFLITVYNGESHIADTIRSIQNQDYSPIEIVVIDDGSTDDTKDILQDLAYLDSRVRPFFPGKLGRGGALNYGLKKSEGKFIAINDADDLSMSDRASLQVDFLTKNQDYGMVGSNFTILNSEEATETIVRKPEGNKAIRDFITLGQPFQHSTVMFRKSMLLSLGGYATNINLLFDREIFIRVLRRSKGYNIQKPLVLIERHQGQFFYNRFSQYERRRMHAKLRIRAILDLGYCPLRILSPVFWLTWEYISIYITNIFIKKSKNHK